MSIAPTTSSHASVATRSASDQYGAVSSAGGVEERRQGDARREDLLGESPRGARGSSVVCFDGGERGGRLLERAEEAEAGALREMLLRARRLDDAGTPAGEVADRPVAHPSGPRLHVRRLRAAELAA